MCTFKNHLPIIYEARQLTEGARKYKVVSQMGNQGASNPGQVQMIEWFNRGLIGTVHTVHVWTNRPVWPQGISSPEATKERPKHISAQDWELFIGPAETVPYDPLYHPCLLYTSPSPRDQRGSRMPSSA